MTASVRVPSDDPGEVRDLSGNPPTDIAGFPGAAGVSEAVFEIGSGTHQFSGPPRLSRTPDGTVRLCYY